MHYWFHFLSDEFIDLEIEDDIAKIIDLCLLDDDRKFLKHYINQASYLFPETRDFLGDFENENNNFLSELDPEILCQILETFLEKKLFCDNSTFFFTSLTASLGGYHCIVNSTNLSVICKIRS